jgi:outer membrane protein TolC
MKKAWNSLAALPLLACFLQAASPAVSEIPLPEKIYPGLDAILRSAVQQSPRMLSRTLELEMADNDRIVARANLLPTLGASYSFNESRDSINYITGPTAISAYSNIVTKTPYSVTLTQPIFHWGERRNNDRIGEIQHKIAQGQYRQGYRLLAQELRGGYLRLIVQKLSLKRARFYQQYVSNQLKLQEERLLKKVISEVEISIARQNAEQAQISLERTEFDFTNAKLSFARLAGLGPIGDESIPDAISETTYAAGSYDQLLAEFLSQKDPVTTEAYNLRQQIEIANLNYANAKTRLLPKVNANLGLSQDEQNNIYGPGTKYSTASRYIGLSVNWNIFDGFAAGAYTRNALIRRRTMESDYQQLTAQLAQDAQTAVKQINFSARNMSIQDRLLVSNGGYLNTVKEDFRRGVKSDSEVGQVQLNVYDAEINASSARMDYLLKIGDFLGTLNEDPIVANLPAKS